MVYSYTYCNLVICVKLINRKKLLGRILPGSLHGRAGPEWEDLSGKLVLNRDVSILSAKIRELLTCQLGGERSGSAETSVLWESRRDRSGLPLCWWVKLGVLEYRCSLPRVSDPDQMDCSSLELFFFPDYKGKSISLCCWHLLRGEEHATVVDHSSPLMGLFLRVRNPGIPAGIWRWDEL